MSFQRRAASFDLARRAGARFMPEESVPAEGDEDMGYIASGTYTPTVTTNGSATVAPALLSGYLRVGNGAGVPLAGDTVTVLGAFTAEGLADGDVVRVSLPFQIAENVYPWCEGTVIPYLGSGIDVTSASFSGPDGAFAFTMGVSGLGDGGVSFTFTYQTANAVDP